MEIFHCCLIVGFYGDYIFFAVFSRIFPWVIRKPEFFRKTSNPAFMRVSGRVRSFPFILFLADPCQSGVKIPEKQFGFTCSGQRADVPVFPVVMIRFCLAKGRRHLEGRT